MTLKRRIDAALSRVPKPDPATAEVWDAATLDGLRRDGLGEIADKLESTGISSLSDTQVTRNERGTYEISDGEIDRLHDWMKLKRKVVHDGVPAS